MQFRRNVKEVRMTNTNERNTLNKIRSRRISLGLTQGELSKKTGINIRQIQKYESGEYCIENMTLKNAIALSDVLNCDVRLLL
ncbi:helix-turn-helix transcriptional regulator [Faecalimonas umbilicata]|uniref:helix-turn-helix transcriptional regulator n=1 Tax=Faecalimonas umbilicata TaxID=1912855 RepID=UPI002FE6C732